MPGGRRMPASELRGKEQNKHGRHDQQKKSKAVACEVAEFLAKDGGDLRTQQAERIGMFSGLGNGTNDGACRGGCLAQFLAAVLCCESHPEKHAEEQRVG